MKRTSQTSLFVMAIWQFQTAKAKLSEVFRAAETESPQTVTVRGKRRFKIIVEPDSAHGGQSLLDVSRPVHGLGVGLELPERRPEPMRNPFDDGGS